MINIQPIPKTRMYVLVVILKRVPSYTETKDKIYYRIFVSIFAVG